MTQNEKVIFYIEKHGSIDPLRAFTDLGIMRLGARIWDLRAAGHKIDTEIKTRQMPNGTVKTWAEYKSRSPVCKTEERQEVGQDAAPMSNSEGITARGACQ